MELFAIFFSITMLAAALGILVLTAVFVGVWEAIGVFAMFVFLCLLFKDDSEPTGPRHGRNAFQRHASDE